MMKFFEKPLYLFIFVFIFSLLIRVPYLGLESINPDAVNWHYRCQQFANGLKYLQFEKTYPHYHPGVTLCYLMVIPTEIYKQITNQTYDKDTFVSFNVLNSYSIVIFNVILISIIAILIGGKQGIVFSILLNLEPFFYGNSRIIHLDVVVSLLLFIGILLLNRFFNENKNHWLFLASLSFALAFLTKSVSIVFVVLAMFSILLFVKKQRLKYLSIFLICFFGFIVILFPAMWVSPIETFTRIFKEADRVGVRTGHNQFFLEEYYDEDSNPGFWFYPVISFVKFSPIFNLSVLLIIYFLISSIELHLRTYKLNITKFINFLDNNKQMFLLLLFYGVYALLIFYSSKKVDRYLLVLVPPIIYYISLKSSQFFNRVFLIFGFINIISLVTFFPNLFNYYSPILLSYENANKLVGQKTFGGGIFELKNYLVGKYGEKNLGFYDVKPMETVYPNSKVFDVRQTSPNKIDILVLSINEKMPDKFANLFEKVETIYSKDIPMYEIYLKK